MKASWLIRDGELYIALVPETEGDRVACLYCDGYAGAFRVEFKSNPYDSRAEQRELRNVQALSASFRPEPKEPEEAV